MAIFLDPDGKIRDHAPMYTDRISEYILLTAPDKTSFYAKWQANPIKAKKRLGKFNFPGVDGTTIQDLGIEGYEWPLTLYFDEDQANGQSDHDTTAKQFLDALAQKGTWSVIHPVYGTHDLQPMEFELKIDPVNSDGAIVIETTWIEVKVQQATVSTAEAASQVLSAAGDVAASASNQSVLDVVQTNSTGIAAIQNSANQAIATVKGYVNVADQTVNGFVTTYQGLLNGAVSIVQLAGTIVNLMTYPGLIIGDVTSKIKSMVTMATTIFSQLPGVAPTNPSAALYTKNSAAVAAAWGNGALIGMAYASVQGFTVGTPAPGAPFVTRSQVVGAINSITGYFSTMTNALDGIQGQFGGISLSGQYFSQSKSFADGLRLCYLTVQYLLKVLFSLNVVKVYTLTTGRSTLEIAMSEYGSKGAWQDSYFDLFCQTNALHGNDLIWLPAGRKVQVYL